MPRYITHPNSTMMSVSMGMPEYISCMDSMKFWVITFSLFSMLFFIAKIATFFINDAIEQQVFDRRINARMNFARLWDFCFAAAFIQNAWVDYEIYNYLCIPVSGQPDLYLVELEHLLARINNYLSIIIKIFGFGMAVRVSELLIKMINHSVLSLYNSIQPVIPACSKYCVRSVPQKQRLIPQYLVFNATDICPKSLSISTRNLAEPDPPPKHSYCLDNSAKRRKSPESSAEKKSILKPPSDLSKILSSQRSPSKNSQNHVHFELTLTETQNNISRSACDRPRFASATKSPHPFRAIKLNDSRLSHAVEPCNMSAIKKYTSCSTMRFPPKHSVESSITEVPFKNLAESLAPQSSLNALVSRQTSASSSWDKILTLDSIHGTPSKKCSNFVSGKDIPRQISQIFDPAKIRRRQQHSFSDLSCPPTPATRSVKIKIPVSESEQVEIATINESAGLESLTVACAKSPEISEILANCSLQSEMLLKSSSSYPNNESACPFENAVTVLDDLAPSLAPEQVTETGTSLATVHTPVIADFPVLLRSGLQEFDGRELQVFTSHHFMDASTCKAKPNLAEEVNQLVESEICNKKTLIPDSFQDKSLSSDFYHHTNNSAYQVATTIETHPASVREIETKVDSETANTKCTLGECDGELKVEKFPPRKNSFRLPRFEKSDDSCPLIRQAAINRRRVRLHNEAEVLRNSPARIAADRKAQERMSSIANLKSPNKKSAIPVFSGLSVSIATRTCANNLPVDFLTSPKSSRIPILRSGKLGQRIQSDPVKALNIQDTDTRVALYPPKSPLSEKIFRDQNFAYTEFTKSEIKESMEIESEFIIGKLKSTGILPTPPDMSKTGNTELLVSIIHLKEVPDSLRTITSAPLVLATRPDEMQPARDGSLKSEAVKVLIQTDPLVTPNRATKVSKVDVDSVSSAAKEISESVLSPLEIRITTSKNPATGEFKISQLALSAFTQLERALSLAIASSALHASISEFRKLALMRSSMYKSSRRQAPLSPVSSKSSHSNTASVSSARTFNFFQMLPPTAYTSIDTFSDDSGSNTCAMARPKNSSSTESSTTECPSFDITEEYFSQCDPTPLRCWRGKQKDVNSLNSKLSCSPNAIEQAAVNDRILDLFWDRIEPLTEASQYLAKYWNNKMTDEYQNDPDSYLDTLDSAQLDDLYDSRVLDDVRVLPKFRTREFEYLRTRMFKVIPSSLFFKANPPMSLSESECYYIPKANFCEAVFHAAENYRLVAQSERTQQVEASLTELDPEVREEIVLRKICQAVEADRCNRWLFEEGEYVTDPLVGDDLFESHQNSCNDSYMDLISRQYDEIFPVAIPRLFFDKVAERHPLKYPPSSSSGCY
ncbi:uncharacterized protein V1516DRAFT_685824 [Lipomyces oligophaga]|uniref:uncharacterized protein n=1 Tax=Lipomyces oligophaga TaxID=45792 RepID=UPI0034D0153E